MGKIDSSIAEYVLFKNSRLKTAVNRQQYSAPKPYSAARINGEFKCLLLKGSNKDVFFSNSLLICYILFMIKICRIKPAILVWCETQSLALEEDPRWNVPEIRSRR
jgi:hypothetical protein